MIFDMSTAPPLECQTIRVSSLSRLISLAYSQFTCVPFSALLAPATFYACNRRSLNFVYFSIPFSFFRWQIQYVVPDAFFRFLFFFLFRFHFDVPDNLGLYDSGNVERVLPAIIRLYQ